VKQRDQAAKQYVHIRTTVPTERHERLRHLAFDLHVSLSDLLGEAVLLALRHHGRADGLREPMPPVASTNELAPVLPPASQAPTPTPTAPPAPPSLTDVVPAPAATNVVAAPEDYFSVDAVLRDSGIATPSRQPPLDEEKGHRR
jgi:hypothetical protein